MDVKTHNLISTIKQVQRQNPFVLVQGLKKKEYGLIEYFVKDSERISQFRNHDLYWMEPLVKQGINPEKDLIINDFEVESRIFPESAIRSVERLIQPYIREQGCIAKKGNVLIFGKTGSEFYKDVGLNSTKLNLDQRISSFLDKFTLIDTD